MRRVLAFLLLLFVAACGAPVADRAGGVPVPAGSGSPAGGGMPRPDHVMVVVFENKSSADVVGNPQAPYLGGLLARSAVFTRSFAVTHPSQPNYLALFSGSTQGVTGDECLARLHGVPNLGAQLTAAGLSFAGYAEGLPYVGYRGCAHGRYVARHNPWVNFDDVPDSANLPLSALPADYARLPTVSFVVPDLCDDTHDCPVATGDAWARAHLDPYVRWADTHDSLLILTYDEDGGDAANHILTLVAGAGVRPGTYAEPITHYTVLRTLEAWYGLPPLGKAAEVAPISGVPAR